MTTIAKAFEVCPLASLFVLVCALLACLLAAGLAYVALVDRREARALDAYWPSESTVEHASAPATVDLRSPTNR